MSQSHGENQSHCGGLPGVCCRTSDDGHGGVWRGDVDRGDVVGCICLAWMSIFGSVMTCYLAVLLSNWWFLHNNEDFRLFKSSFNDGLQMQGHKLIKVKQECSWVYHLLLVGLLEIASL